MPSAWWWAAPMPRMQAAHRGPKPLRADLVAGFGVVGDRAGRVVVNGNAIGRERAG